MRIFFLLTTLCLTFVLSRAIIRGVPGDPIETIVAETGTTVPVEVLKKELGLDRPFVEGVLYDFKNITHGDWGFSIMSREPVVNKLLKAFRKTLYLSFASLFFGLTFSLLLGIGSCAFPNTKLGHSIDLFCSLYGSMAAALPTPWTGPILIYLLSIVFPIFPPSGNVVLPALTLSFTFSGMWARLIRERVRETLFLGAAKGARARGIPEWKVLLKYGFSPALGTLLAYLGTQTGSFLSGALITEMIFNWNGMGSLLIDAVFSRDYPVVEAAVFWGAACTLIGTAMGDWLSGKVDPRLEPTQ